MNGLAVRAYCVVPTEVLKALFFIGIGGLLLIGAARMAGIFVPLEWVVGLVGFFFAGAILAVHGLSLLRKPGLVLLFGVSAVVAAVLWQDLILSLFA